MAVGNDPIGSFPVGGASASSGGGGPNPFVMDLESNAEITASMGLQPFWLPLTSALNSAGILEPFGGGFVLVSRLEATGELSLSHATNLVSALSMASSIGVHLQGGMTLASAMEMADVLRITHVLELVSSLEMATSSEIEHAKAVLLVSEMVFGSTLDTQAEMAISVASAMTAASLLAYGYDLALVSSAELASAFERRYNAVIEAQSALEATGEVSVGRSIDMVFLSGAGASSSMDTQAELQLDLLSAMEGRVVFKLGDDIYQGWVLGVETAAFTEYSSYPFNSIAMFKGKPYGAAEDGIYLLEGDDDVGEPIEAAVKTKLTAFRQRAIKDAKAVYVGYTSSGRLVLKATVDRGGELHEYWYREKKGASASMRTGRFTLGRGLRSTYWQFELVNEDGADFEIEDVTIMYEVLSRRIR